MYPLRPVYGVVGVYRVNCQIILPLFTIDLISSNFALEKNIGGEKLMGSQRVPTFEQKNVLYLTSWL